MRVLKQVFPDLVKMCPLPQRKLRHRNNIAHSLVAKQTNPPSPLIPRLLLTFTAATAKRLAASQDIAANYNVLAICGKQGTFRNHIATIMNWAVDFATIIGATGEIGQGLKVIIVPENDGMHKDDQDSEMLQQILRLMLPEATIFHVRLQ